MDLREEISRLERQRVRDIITNLDGDEEAFLNVFYLVFNGQGNIVIKKI